MISRGILTAAQNHSRDYWGPFQRLLRTFIAQSALNSLLKFESTVCEQIVPDHIVDIRGGVEVTRQPFTPFAYLWTCNMAGFHLHFRGKGVRRTQQLWSYPTYLSNASESLDFGFFQEDMQTPSGWYFSVYQAHFPRRCESWGKECAPSEMKVSCLYLSIFVTMLLDNVFIYNRENLYA